MRLAFIFGGAGSNGWAIAWGRRRLVIYMTHVRHTGIGAGPVRTSTGPRAGPGSSYIRPVSGDDGPAGPASGPVSVPGPVPGPVPAPSYIRPVSGASGPVPGPVPGPGRGRHI